MIKLLIVLCIPLAIDLFTCYLELKRNKRGSGASGLPIVTLFLYGLIIIYSPFANFYQKILTFILAIIIHILIVVVIPNIDAKRYKLEQ
jgi:hypothetical protein